jgi:hypothetical protein
VPVYAVAAYLARAITIAALYLGLAGLLVVGMLATHPEGGL